MVRKSKGKCARRRRVRGGAANKLQLGIARNASRESAAALAHDVGVRSPLRREPPAPAPRICYWLRPGKAMVWASEVRAEAIFARFG